MSIKKVAELAGVSIATVSRSFSHPELLKKETLEKVEQARKTLQYHPNSLAQNFRRGKSNIIVVIIDNIGDPIYERFTQTISKIATPKGYDVLIKETHYQPLSTRYYRDILSSKQADGLIVMIDPPEMNSKTQALFDELPIVFVRNDIESKTDRHIGLNNFEAAKSATEHLIELGHKTIAYITLDIDNVAYTHRERGFIEAITDSGLEAPHITRLDNRCDIAHSNLDTLLTTTPTAIFCANDDIAIDVLAYLRTKSIDVPQDISVIGFNNIRYSTKTSPPLTTVEFPLDNIAQYAIENLCAIIDDNAPPLNPNDSSINTDRFDHRLVIRSSTSSAIEQ